MPSTMVRLQRLRAAATAQGPTAQGPTAQGPTVRALDDFRALLADHADYPHSICAHPDPADHPCDQSATIASVLMDLNARHLWLAKGNPCQVPYECLDIIL
jgi:isopenicillin-N N-acyltransferase like protein